VACNRTIEVTSMLTEYERTVVAPDGSLTSEIAAVPQRTHHSDGTWGRST
jgi:hypothetical protein